MRVSTFLLAGATMAACLLSPTLRADGNETEVAAPAAAPAIAVAPAKGAVIGAWTQDLAAARQLASEQNLPILLNFTGSDWCGVCEHAEAAIFSRPEWATYAKKNMVLVTLDYPQDASRVPVEYRERNMLLQQEFGVRGYPTFVILDSDGKSELGRLGMGRGLEAPGFIQQVEEVLLYMPQRIEARAKALGDEGDAYKAAIAAAQRTSQVVNDLQGRMTRSDWAVKEKRMPFITARHEETLAKLALMDFSVRDEIAALESPEKQAQATSAWAEARAAHVALSEFLIQDPEQTQANMATFQTLNQAIMSRTQALQAALTP